MHLLRPWSLKANTHEEQLANNTKIGCSFDEHGIGLRYVVLSYHGRPARGQPHFMQHAISRGNQLLLLRSLTIWMLDEIARPITTQRLTKSSIWRYPYTFTLAHTSNYTTGYLQKETRLVKVMVGNGKKRYILWYVFSPFSYYWCLRLMNRLFTQFPIPTRL